MRHKTPYTRRNLSPPFQGIGCNFGPRERPGPNYLSEKEKPVSTGCPNRGWILGDAGLERLQNGAPPWNRTKNLVIKSHLLCQLS